ncbi:hypothetical protein Skr01_57050 [Sphaerisporangium krabiense]|uniref:Uncharacterized protein n=1 Tax=Sphaerisporangium krabiense TaxID=763782 RepID=A0A7W9DSB8_9ACTN|nr:hypothetical protein [Sphaerisporangium krabiense]MBB5629527.1 hypothetical protein [Sphaerisporangium krabiense]GII65620.1 hypothetical protein Skr01_57050 [Sphaerisporangium krabiense]
MAEWAKSIESIAHLVGALAWPIAVVLAVWLLMRRHHTAFGRLIDRVKSFGFPGGQVDLGEIEAAQEDQVDKLVEQAVDPGASEDLRQNAIRSLSRSGTAGRDPRCGQADDGEMPKLWPVIHCQAG